MTSPRWATARFVFYVVYALGAPVLKYCEARGWTGQPEYDLYLGIGTAVGITAAANVPRFRQRVMGVIKRKDGEVAGRIDAEVRPGEKP